jgi:uncharacterized protein (DUF488 family)
MMAAEKQHMQTLYTIGHSTHPADAFLHLLTLHQIDLIADVRSSPYSRMTPQFDREALAALLKNHKLQYLFLGQELGARRSEPACYAGDKARYDLIARAPLFQAGLQRVRQCAAQNRVALLCAEKDPITCHRTVLVCRHLRQTLPAINHILSDGTIETQQQAEERMMQEFDLAGGSLFESREQLIERAYDLQGDKIAYVKDPIQNASDIR